MPFSDSAEQKLFDHIIMSANLEKLSSTELGVLFGWVMLHGGSVTHTHALADLLCERLLGDRHDEFLSAIERGDSLETIIGNFRQGRN